MERLVLCFDGDYFVVELEDEVDFCFGCGSPVVQGFVGEIVSETEKNVVFDEGFCVGSFFYGVEAVEYVVSQA